jgi:hypothetical protein
MKPPELMAEHRRFLIGLTVGLARSSASENTELPCDYEERRSAAFGAWPRWDHIMIIFEAVTPSRVNSAMRKFRMARKLDAFREIARMALEPWLSAATSLRLLL